MVIVREREEERKEQKERNRKEERERKEVREREEERKEQKERNIKDTAWQEKENADDSDTQNNGQSYDHIKMAKNVDKLSFGFCLIMFVLFNVLFWSLYL